MRVGPSCAYMKLRIRIPMAGRWLCRVRLHAHAPLSNTNKSLHTCARCVPNSIRDRGCVLVQMDHATAAQVVIQCLANSNPAWVHDHKLSALQSRSQPQTLHALYQISITPLSCHASYTCASSYFQYTCKPQRTTDTSIHHAAACTSTSQIMPKHQQAPTAAW